MTLHKRSQPVPLSDLHAVVGAARGLAEALAILGDIESPQSTRRQALAEALWYLERFSAAHIRVDLKDVAGEAVTLERGKLPPRAVDSIALRSMHPVTLRMLSAAHSEGGTEQLKSLLSRRTPLGSGTFVLPVNE